MTQPAAPSDAPSCFAECFGRIYILNLPERADRRADMLRELQAARFPVPGSTGARCQFFPAIRPAEPAGFPSLGARGCFLSHLAMLKQARHDGVANLLILEDDLSFSPLIPLHDARLAAITRDSPWHFAYFGHVLERSPVSESPILERCDERIVTTHFYAVKGSVLDPLIAFLETLLTRPPGDPAGGPMHVDGALSTFRRANPQFTTLVARPSLGSQRSSRSDVAPLRWFDRAPILRQSAALFRRLKSSRPRN